MSTERKGRTVVVNIADIQQTLFVRDKLNLDWVTELGLLILDGQELPPLLINEQMELIDGRHRLAAYQDAEVTEVKAKMIAVTDKAEMLSIAYQSNIGGSLPPTAEDREKAVAELIALEPRISNKRLAELLGVPVGAAKLTKQTILSKIARRKMQSAKQAVAEGMTVSEAALEYDVEPDKLKIEIMGRKTKRGGVDVAAIKRSFTSAQKSSTGHRASTFTKLREQYEEGEITKAQLGEIVKHALQLAKTALRSTEEQAQRMEAMFKSSEAC